MAPGRAAAEWAWRVGGGLADINVQIIVRQLGQRAVVAHLRQSFVDGCFQAGCTFGDCNSIQLRIEAQARDLNTPQR